MKRNLSVPKLSRSAFSLAVIGVFSFAVMPIASADGVDKGEDTVKAEFFAAMDSGQIDVKYIPQDATKANILVKNLTDKPLHIELPAAFAGVPVNAQFGGGGMGGGGMGGGGMGGGGMGGGGGQAGGGGMGGGGMMGGGGGMGGGGMGGGFMRVPPSRMKKMAVKTVCLEHGKPDPNPKIPYKIVPISQFTKDARIHAICEAVGKNMVTQNTAQAATWHLTDKLSWEELAKKNRVESKYTGNVRWFSPFELRTAVAVVNEAKRLAEDFESKNAEKKEYDGQYDG